MPWGCLPFLFEDSESPEPRQPETVGKDRRPRTAGPWLYKEQWLSLEPQKLWPLLSIPSRHQFGDAQPITELLSLSTSLLLCLLLSFTWVGTCSDRWRWDEGGHFSAWNLRGSTSPLQVGVTQATESQPTSQHIHKVWCKLKFEKHWVKLSTVLKPGDTGTKPESSLPP